MNDTELNNLVKTALEQLTDSISVDIPNAPQYIAKLKVYQSLVTAGIPKPTVQTIIGDLKVEVLPEVVFHKDFEKLTMAFAKIIAKIYDQMSKDYGDEKPFIAVAKTFEFSVTE